MTALGFDTSNYTTSIAYYSEQCVRSCARLLPVKEGALGLRQSDALFHHVTRLPDLAKELFSEVEASDICAIGVSNRPRDVEGSYMPCFLAGESQAQVLAQVLKVPLYRFSHQQGHIAAAVWSAGRMDLLDAPHLAWHLSGGTTELLLVEPQVYAPKAQRIGGTEDISAGQLIDRTGKLLGLPFPAGKAVDALSRETDATDFFRVKLRGLEFSFSGLQNKTEQYFEKTASAEKTAQYALRSVIEAVLAVTRAAMKQYPDLPVVFSGGVASNSLLRELAGEFQPIFAKPEFSTDNAMGTAILAARQEH